MVGCAAQSHVVAGFMWSLSLNTGALLHPKNSTDGEAKAFYVSNAEATPREGGDLVMVIHHTPCSVDICCLHMQTY